MAEAADSTILFHPHVLDLTRERSDPEEIKAHVEAGWLTEDPKLAEKQRAEDAAEAAKRSEAARKGAETRKRKAEQPSVNPADSDGPAVVPVSEPTQ